MAAALSAAAFGDDTSSIVKCRDAKGIWHYGDAESTDCGNSEFTIINREGVEVKPAPPQGAKAANGVDAQAAEQARKDKLLLATYISDQDIIQARDRRLAEIDAAIGATQQTVDALRATLTRMASDPADAKIVADTQSQIDRQEREIAAQRSE